MINVCYTYFSLYPTHYVIDTQKERYYKYDSIMCALYTSLTNTVSSSSTLNNNTVKNDNEGKNEDENEKKEEKNTEKEVNDVEVKCIL